MLYVGRPIADLIRWSAERAEMNELGAPSIDEEGHTIDGLVENTDKNTVEAQVRRRLAHLRAGRPYVFQRVRANGQVIEMRGQPLPGGGYVTSFSDITDYKRAERALREINETLEQRVELRTREAEAAQQSKTRFLAAVSHDVLQPLNAARLFASALRETEDGDERSRLAERVDTALRAAEDLLDGLLDVSRLDAGALQPEWSHIEAAELLRELAAQYAPSAAGRGLALRVHARPGLFVRSDRRLLRRALQNFLANALRYTREGGVLLALRVRGDDLELQVWDTGPGIPTHHLGQIFDEFRRFDVANTRADIGGERGLGLGLSICQRIARILGHPLQVHSRVGAGSVFSIRVPVAEAVPARAPVAAATLAPDALAGLRVLCVDNDPEILDGMRALLSRWGAVALTAATVDEALAHIDPDGPSSLPDVALVDYHLHDRLDGLGVIAELRRRAKRDLPAALLTGDGSDTLKRAAREYGCAVLTKPVKPASLRAWLAARG
jgi:signal transduction histidine kinase